VEHPAKDPSQIKGRGVDADPKNDPTYPMKNRSEGEHAGYSWERPPQQPITVEVLHSNERPDLTSVFGTSTPPSGLSGVLRRLAFRASVIAIELPHGSHDARRNPMRPQPLQHRVPCPSLPPKLRGRAPRTSSATPSLWQRPPQWG
jgi:hypothetical protein